MSDETFNLIWPAQNSSSRSFLPRGALLLSLSVSVWDEDDGKDWHSRSDLPHSRCREGAFNLPFPPILFVKPGVVQQTWQGVMNWNSSQLMSTPENQEGERCRITTNWMEIVESKRRVDQSGDVERFPYYWLTELPLWPVYFPHQTCVLEKNAFNMCIHWKSLWIKAQYGENKGREISQQI